MALKAFMYATITSLCFAACGRNDGHSSNPPPSPEERVFSLNSKDPSKHTVMVVDRGFDLTNKIFAGKILGAYTLKCKEVLNEQLSGTIDELKKQFYKQQVEDDQSCELSSGIEPHINPKFKEVIPDRDAWNNWALMRGRGKSGEELPIPSTYYYIDNLLSGRDGYYYHGTATAGLVSYKNPNVQFVFVDIPLTTTAESREKIKCISESERDAQVSIWKDPDIAKFFVERPLSNLEQATISLTEQYSVSIRNESFGHFSRQTLEQYLRGYKNCPQVDLSPWYEARVKLLEQRELWIEKNYAKRLSLVTKAAGNSMDEINSPKDSLDCFIGSGTKLVIGATNHYGGKAYFTNYGKCIDLYAGGQDVVISAPYDFLSTASGTSFSAPLTTRYVSMNFSPDMPAQDMKKSLLTGLTGKVSETLVTEGKTFSRGQMPEELFYDSFQTIDQYRGIKSLPPPPRTEIISMMER